MGACDCCQKHAIDVEMFALETIPIASRMGIASSIFSEIAAWAKRIQDISSVRQIESGKFDEQYITEAGVVSTFRKSVDKMLTEVKTGADCPECEELRRLSRLISERRKASD